MKKRIINLSVNTGNTKFATESWEKIFKQNRRSLLEENKAI